MFGIKNKKESIELVDINSEEFKSALKIIHNLLYRAGHNGQAEFIKDLLNLLLEGELNQFIKLINSVEMWGGSGAVWEVNFENKEDAKNFEAEIITIISLMEKTKILGRGIKPIRKIFEKNLG